MAFRNSHTHSHTDQNKAGLPGSGRLPPDTGHRQARSLGSLRPAAREYLQGPARYLLPRGKGPKLGASQTPSQETKQNKNRGSGISKKLGGDGVEETRNRRQTRERAGAVAARPLGPHAARAGGVCRSGGEARCPKPNRRPEAPREEEKKAEPADLEAGAFRAGAEPMEEAGLAGPGSRRRGGPSRSLPGGAAFSREGSLGRLGPGVWLGPRDAASLGVWASARFLRNWRNWIRSVPAPRGLPRRPSLGRIPVRQPRGRVCRAPRGSAAGAQAALRWRGAGRRRAGGVLTDPSSSRGAARR